MAEAISGGKLDPNPPVCPVHGKRTGTRVQRGDYCDVVDDAGQCPLLLIYPDKADPTNPYIEEATP